MRNISVTAAACMVAVCASGSCESKELLSIRDAIDTTRVMASVTGERVFPSPDGTRYALITVTGDAARDGVRLALLVGRLDSVNAAAPAKVVELFSRGYGRALTRFGGATGLTSINTPTWIDNRSVVFYWEDEKGTRQLVSVNVNSRRLDFVTRHEADVVGYDIGAHGTVVYLASVPHDSSHAAQMWNDGFAVQSDNLLSALAGNIDGYGAVDFMFNSEFFITGPEHLKPRRVRLMRAASVNTWPPMTPFTALFDPKERFALVSATPDTVPTGWGRYTHPHLVEMLRERSVNPAGTYARQFQQLYVVDTRSAVGTPLWNAPVEPFGLTRAAWSPDATSILIGPTFLPFNNADSASLAGRAVAVVDVASANYARVPLAPDAAEKISSLHWESPTQLVIGLSGEGALKFEKVGSNWIPSSRSLRKAQRAARARPLSVQIEEDLNTPPRLVGIETRTKKRHLLYEFNPSLTSKFVLGRTEHFTWQSPTDAALGWRGRLYYPSNYRPGSRYPLVVQNHGEQSSSEFSLYGSSLGLGPGHAVYLAQLLATRGIAVIQGDAKPTNLPTSFERMRETLRAQEGAIEELVAEGLVDKTHVGLMGYSASGWPLEYELSHSKFPYAAAIVVDNVDGGYFQAGVMSWVIGAGERMNAAAPFGEGLKEWLERAPPFSAENVHTPLQMQVTDSQGGGRNALLVSWEMFSRLRYLGKPVELYIAPRIDLGSHVLQNPSQLLATQGRALDWWLFWLQGREDNDSQKRAQYESWRELRARAQLHVDSGASAH